MRAAARALAVAAAVAASAVGLVAAAPVAAAHVGVDPSTTAPGGYAVLTFRVPTESPAASTVKLTVHLPAGTPFTSVRTEPVPGWDAHVTTSPLETPLTDDDGDTVTSAPSEVTWTATDGGLAPGQFAELRLAVGPMPPSGTVFFPAVQVYSDGTQVAWTEQAQGGAEPEHPAPSVTIAAAGQDAAAGVVSAPTADDDAAGGALGVAIAALVVAAVGAALAAAALVRSRRVPAGSVGAPGPAVTEAPVALDA